MKTFNKSTFQNILKRVDFQNEYDFETFSESLLEYFDVLTEGDTEEIIDYLDNDLGISSDSDIHGLSTSGIKDLCEFINDLLD
ncbi:MAG: hypothetical protein JEZ08_08270 [Clostridiales bacterium]|nr:hypothetical protein [Clostridiales bacterium]